MKRNQDKFQKNKQYRGIVRKTKILTDYRRSFKQVQTNGNRRNIKHTNTSSSNKQEHTGRNTKEHGTGPRIV